jgi:hypothetical protein
MREGKKGDEKERRLKEREREREYVCLRLKREPLLLNYKFMHNKKYCLDFRFLTFF